MSTRWTSTVTFRCLLTSCLFTSRIFSTFHVPHFQEYVLPEAAWFCLPQFLTHLPSRCDFWLYLLKYTLSHFLHLLLSLSCYHKGKFLLNLVLISDSKTAEFYCTYLKIKPKQKTKMQMAYLLEPMLFLFADTPLFSALSPATTVWPASPSTKASISPAKSVATCKNGSKMVTVNFFSIKLNVMRIKGNLYFLLDLILPTVQLTAWMKRGSKKIVAWLCENV